MIIRVLAATLAGGITSFLLGWLIYGVLLMDFMKANTAQPAGFVKEPPDFIFIFLFNLVFAWLAAFIFEYWAGIRTFVGGLKGGALIWFPIALASNLQMYAFTNLFKSFTPVIVDVIAATVLGAITGGVIALVLGLMNKKADLE